MARGSPTETRNALQQIVLELSGLPVLTSAQKTKLTKATNKLKSFEEAKPEAAVPGAVDQPPEPIFGMPPTQEEQAFLRRGPQSPNPHGARSAWDPCMDSPLDVNEDAALEVLIQHAADNGIVEVTQYAADNGIVEVTLPAAEAEALAAMEVDTPGKTDAAAELAAGEEALAAMEVDTPGKTDAADELAAEKYLMILFSLNRSIEIRVHALDWLVGKLANPIFAYQNAEVMLSLLDFCIQLLEHAAQNPPLGGATFLDPRRLFGTNTMRLHEKVNTFLCHIIAPGARLENLEGEKWKRFMAVLACHMADNSFPTLQDQSTAPQRQAHVPTPDMLAFQAYKCIMSANGFSAWTKKLTGGLERAKDLADELGLEALFIAAWGSVKAITKTLETAQEGERGLVPHTRVFDRTYDETAAALETLAVTRETCLLQVVRELVRFLTSEIVLAYIGNSVTDLRAKVENIQPGVFAATCTRQAVPGGTKAHDLRDAGAQATKDLQLCKTIEEVLIETMKQVTGVCEKSSCWGIGPLVVATMFKGLDENERDAHRLAVSTTRRKPKQDTDQKPAKEKKTERATGQTTDNSAEQDSDGKPIVRKKRKTKPTQSAELTDKQQHIGSTFDTTDNELAQGPGSEISDFRQGDGVPH